MKLQHLFLLLLLVAIPMRGQSRGRNIAYNDGQVRFTVISDGMLRLEYAPDGKWVDLPTFVASEREYPTTKFDLKEGEYIEITTPKLKLKYLKGSGPFTAQNLSITSTSGDLPYSWNPGMKQKHNLKGTARTLDAFDGDTHQAGHKIDLGEGILARDGWTLIDNSKGLIFETPAKEWFAKRNSTQGAQDWYFLGYGTQYKDALRDFSLLSGKIPLPPLYAFGYWWSRYWSYSDAEMQDLVHNFEKNRIPIDVMVVDMDWHYTEEGKGGWTGFTWNRRLFPDYKAFLASLRDKELKVTLNIHPADGVASYEEMYPEMAKWMGLPEGSTERIPWISSDRRYMEGIMKYIFHPYEEAGVDFWWLDWQQHLQDPKVPELSNTWWINHWFFNDMARQGKHRPMIFHRWGGLGNHRYQIGFSGDAIVSWKSLDFQPYFNSTASNVLYGYWGHDLGGHFGGELTPELYVRWLQFGEYTPIMRTHSGMDATLNKEPWTFDHRTADILASTIRDRYRLVPYIYSMARKSFDTAISICRPMYYDYPTDEKSYELRNQYMFGDRILIAPITHPMEGKFSRIKVWLPEGDQWYECSTGTLLEGGQLVERSFALDEYPVYVKAGTILPTYTDAQRLNSLSEPVTFEIYPGTSGEGSFYEDQGDSQDYARNFATTELNFQRNGNTLTVVKEPRKGQYDGMLPTRKVTVKVIASPTPVKVVCNGKELASQSIHYDAERLELCIDLPEDRCDVRREVKITYAEDAPQLTDGFMGSYKRLRQALVGLKYRHVHIVLSEELGRMGSVGRLMSYHPERQAETVEYFRTHFRNLPEILKSGLMKISEEDRKGFLEAVDWKSYSPHK